MVMQTVFDMRQPYCSLGFFVDQRSAYLCYDSAALETTEAVATFSGKANEEFVNHFVSPCLCTRLRGPNSKIILTPSGLVKRLAKSCIVIAALSKSRRKVDTNPLGLKSFGVTRRPFGFYKLGVISPFVGGSFGIIH